MKIFFDTEFTGLHQKTTLISIGAVTEQNHSFYAEFTDYDRSQVDKWVFKNVIQNLVLMVDHDGVEAQSDYDHNPNRVTAIGPTHFISGCFEDWLKDIGEKKYEMWSDCLAYDWVLFNQMWGHAFNLPESIYYIPFDICTLFRINGIDPDINRENFAGSKPSGELKKHNALWDAMIIKKCYENMA
jgi:hypothetical protein